MSAADPRRQQLSELTECAYRLGVMFGEEAERAEDPARRTEYFQLFDRCFFSVRVGISLDLRLRREPVTLRPEAAGEDLRAERDPSEAEAAERERPERTERPERYDERDRDRDREAASLPVLLRTLGAVAADAAALPGPEPAALPSLRELLAQMTSPPPPTGERPIPRTPGAGPGLRARLAGSATAPILTATALAPPPRPASSFGLPLRRATGPPRR